MSKALQHEERVVARKNALQLLYQGDILENLLVLLLIIVSWFLKHRDLMTMH